MDQEEQEHESRWRKLPTEPHTGQVTYWRQWPEVSPDEDLRSEVETLENKSFFGYIKLIGSYGQIVRLLDLV